ncbi:MAG: sigma-70 family RNA polymerase sigma factor [Saprospiraceae bacterium]|nr:sigma-70 family RNA polymerase sigma factor [Saprospiraceae bacterium]
MTDNPIQNFGLKAAEFAQLRANLLRGDEALFERVFVKHFDDCRSYLMRQCTAQADDAYDITLETIIAFRKRLVEGKVDYGNLRFYFTKMAKDNYLKFLDKNKREPTAELTEKEADRAAADDSGFDEDQLTALDSSWSKLGEECKKLLKSHIYDGLQLKVIAQTLNEAETNIRKRKERCMDKLKSHFFELYIP